MASEIFVKAGSDNSLLPDSIKLLPEQFFFFYLTQCWLTINKVLSQYNVYLTTQAINLQLCLKFTHLKSQQHLPGANELSPPRLFTHPHTVAGPRGWVLWRCLPCRDDPPAWRSVCETVPGTDSHYHSGWWAVEVWWHARYSLWSHWNQYR